MTYCPHNDKSKYVDCAKEVLRLNSLMAGKVLVDPYGLERVLDCARAAEGNDEHTDMWIIELSKQLEEYLSRSQGGKEQSNA